MRLLLLCSITCTPRSAYSRERKKDVSFSSLVSSPRSFVIHLYPNLDLNGPWRPTYSHIMRLFLLNTAAYVMLCASTVEAAMKTYYLSDSCNSKPHVSLCMPDATVHAARRRVRCVRVRADMNYSRWPLLCLKLWILQALPHSVCVRAVQTKII